MKFRLFFSVCCLGTQLGFGQVSLKKMGLVQGAHDVGFSHYTAIDSTRTYRRASDWSNAFTFRPVPVSVWYPAKPSPAPGMPLTVQNYLEILKQEEEWEHLPSGYILSWFYYADTPVNKGHLGEKAKARLGAGKAAGKFPLVVYAPSYQASSIENFALCEFLASHGYVVIASPSRGTESRPMEGGTGKDMETQARDIEFLLKEAYKHENIDRNEIATMGFSFGGLSNVLSALRDKNIRAVVSLDGSIKYQYPTLRKSPFNSVENFKVPFIHFAQKDIPSKVLIEDGVDPTLNHAFDFYDSLTNSRAYSFKFHHLTHPYFSTLGVLFQERDARQDKSDAEIMESYRLLSRYTLHFLNSFLKGDENSLTLLEAKPADGGSPAGLVTKEWKLPGDEEFSFEDFNGMAQSDAYRDLYGMYEAVRSKHPSFKPEEWRLNDLGLHLVFDPQSAERGIRVLAFATKVYPESANLFDSLAEGHLFLNDREEATVNFRKSLQLNPQNRHAVDRLKQLGVK